MKYSVLAALASAALASGFPLLAAVDSAVATVSKLDVNSYTGRWIQVAANQKAISSNQQDLVCVTAEYTAKTDGTVGVFNAAQKGSNTGPYTTIKGTARIPNPAEPGKLSVSLDGVPFPFPYYVHALGPVVNGKYEYAIVGDAVSPNGVLFVLTRDVQRYYQKYAAEVKAKLNEFGFTGSNGPITTNQNGCQYNPPREDVNLLDMLDQFRADDVVKQVDVNAYSGRWFQMYANAAVMNTFEKDNVCVTADYSLKTDGKIAVLNQARLKTVDGQKTIIKGEAAIPNPAEPGKLTVSLEGTPFPAPYWIMGLGPIVNGKYQWAVVADSVYPLGTLFILGRDVNSFRANYEKDALSRANELGFNTFINKPIKTVQDGCTYTEELPAFRPQPVSQVDVNAYKGRWFQQYANAAVMNTFEKDNVCVTADYSLNADGTIAVFNQARLKTVDGEKTTIKGQATVPNPAEPGKLSVSLEGTPFPAPYWIMGLGPIVNGKYQWAVVADSAFPLGTLFILGRDTNSFRANYEKDALALANELGFNNFFNKPIKTVQDGCTYLF